MNKKNKIIFLVCPCCVHHVIVFLIFLSYATFLSAKLSSLSFLLLYILPPNILGTDYGHKYVPALRRFPVHAQQAEKYLFSLVTVIGITKYYIEHSDRTTIRHEVGILVRVPAQRGRKREFLYFGINKVT